MRRILVLLALLLLCIGATRVSAQLPDGTVRISGVRPADVSFTRDGRHFLARLDDSLRVYETATGQQAGVPIAVPKREGYAAGFIAGDSTVLVMPYNSGTAYQIWNWRTGQFVDSERVYRTVQWAHVMANGRKMAMSVSEPTERSKRYEMWEITPEAKYNGSFLDTSVQCSAPVFDSTGEYAAAHLVVRVGATLNSKPIRIHRFSGNIEEIDTVQISAQPFRDLRITHDGRRISVTRRVGVQRVFDGMTLDSLFVVDIPRQQSVFASLDFTPGNQWLICASTSDTGLPKLEIRHGGTGEVVRMVAVDTAFRYMTVAVSPAGNCAVLYQPNDDQPNNDILVVPLGLLPTRVGVIAGEWSKGLHAWPNPAREELIAEYRQLVHSNVRVRLVASNGAEMYLRDCGEREAGTYSERIATAGLPSGAYFLIVEESGVRRIVPMMIEH